ncbi:MAG: signal peptidase II [Rhizobiales bacterium]|nr:signal peptidase II [Hyphomicrobiales bacterium]
MIQTRLLPALTLGIVIADLATKALAAAWLDASGVAVLPVVNLTLGFNRGVSFGLFAADGMAGRTALVGLTIVAIAAIGVLAWRTVNPIERMSYALIGGGALGNLVDRLHDGAVTDFIDLHAVGWHFPTFNIADVAITGGAVLLFLAAFRRSPKFPNDD